MEEWCLELADRASCFQMFTIRNRLHLHLPSWLRVSTALTSQLTCQNFTGPSGLGLGHLFPTIPRAQLRLSAQRSNTQHSEEPRGSPRETWPHSLPTSFLQRPRQVSGALAAQKEGQAVQGQRLLGGLESNVRHSWSF